MIELIAATIPLTLFDQQKLEFLVRKIPEALVRIEEKNGVKKKFYSFPTKLSHGFRIKCESEYYLDATIPSFSSCKMEITKPLNDSFDEHKIEIDDTDVVNSIVSSLSYTNNVKKLYSLERVYGVALNGNYQKHFRFGFECSIKKCQLTLSTKPAENF